MATAPPITDLRRTHPKLYRAPDTPVRLTVPPLAYLMLDGAGDPRLGSAHPGDARAGRRCRTGCGWRCSTRATALR